MGFTLNKLQMEKQIKELELHGGGTAADVEYDPTASHLEATNVQDAIDELSGEIAGLSADDVSYDGTDSGLSSTTVQGAVDEVLADCAAIDYRVASEVTADGVKTWKEIINQLFDGVTVTALGDWRLRNGSEIFHFGTASSTTKEFCRINGATSTYVIDTISYNAASGHDNTFYNQLNLKPDTAISVTDLTSVVPSQGTTLQLLNRLRNNP